MDIRIRDVKPADAEGIVNILNPLIQEGKHTALDQPFTMAREKHFIQTFPEKGIFLKAENDEKIILGFQVTSPFADYTTAHDHVGTIGTYVDPAHQRQGIGEMLCNQTFIRASEMGYKKLFSYVLADNSGALAFYQKVGFQIIGLAKDHAFVKGNFHDQLIIEKFL